MAEYHFKTVVHQEDLKGLKTSGLIGLAPSAGEFDPDPAQMFVPTLFEQGAIKENLFAIFISQAG